MDLIAQIQQAGVVGAGGAGFPTHVKLNAQAEYLIINAAECEPLLQTDQYLMKNQALQLIGGILMSQKQIGAEKAVIAVKGKYKEAIASLHDAITRLGASVEIFELQNFYPAGDEQMTVFEVTGRSVPPGGIPLNVGCVVSNVATMIGVFDAAQGIPVTYKYVSILGEVREPRVIRVPVGTSFEECLAAAGGTVSSDFAIIRGGPMMGGIVTKDDLPRMNITKTDGALIVIPADHYLVERSQLTEEQILMRAKACIQCGFCTQQCPRYLIGHDLHPHKMMNVIKYGMPIDESCSEALLCCACGVCEMYACPMGIDPRQVNIIIANKLRAQGIRYQHDSSNIIAREGREDRKVDPYKLINRLDLSRWDHQELHEFKAVDVDTVTLSLWQHIGAGSEPQVRVGDRVETGKVIGTIPEGKLGSTIHASISGVVTAVDNDSITISRNAA
ncbi:4Fe-4S dicluster domain-containing protein [Parendozoicomonas haliclonae]|uniref:Electron transport complex protein RnfC n=1 Tax=Parendozoicomonas haliclonae TaxID=1960125 RepID=A0A1X7ALJ5_9GAMM|nr:4Fe-4S dicluster domain-containing protein [Parendozoicomonas haliclonae]SMA48863.1 Electron transport complex protein RnfC [Parendozoicomonas haliclonae]